MISSRLELVIFDCDGVLVDSEPIINQAHASVLTACGYSITERELVDRFCGMTIRKCSQSLSATGAAGCRRRMASVSKC